MPKKKVTNRYTKNHLGTRVISKVKGLVLFLKFVIGFKFNYNSKHSFIPQVVINFLSIKVSFDLNERLYNLK